MRRAAGALAALGLISGCAMMAPVSEPAYKSAVTTTGVETEAATRARVHTELAGGYFELGNMSVALEEVKEALRSDPNYGPAYNVAGLIYAELKEDRYANENFQRALRINPLDSDANNNYGRFLCDRKREEEAIRYFQAALRNPLYQTPERSYVNAGLCARRRGDTGSAEDYFRKALEVRPNQPQALYQLADIEYARGSYVQAKEHLSRLARLAAPNPEILWLSMRVERRLGDPAAAASYRTQLTKNFPESKEAKAVLAGRDE
jgi:type IV pilus assembly protein PilF